LKEELFKDPRLWLDDINPLIREDERQVKKWGIQSVTLFEWLAYLTEEIGELAEAILEYTNGDGKSEEIMNEAIQAATLALKIAKMAEGVRE